MSTSLTPAEVRAQVHGAEEDILENRDALERATEKAFEAVREPLVYQQHTGGSYFGDLVQSRRGNSAAGLRLEHHGRQMRAVARRVETRRFDGAVFEQRVNPNLTEGTGGEFAPPLWLNELFASVPRSSAVIQRLAPTYDLPDGVDSVNLTRMKTGTAVGDQNAGGAVPGNDTIETTPCKAYAVSFEGMSDWSIQTMDQSVPALDWVVTKDLAEALDYAVEQQLVYGLGGTEEVLGLLNVTGVKAIENKEEVKLEKMFPLIGQLMAQVGVNRKKPPTAWLMNTARLAWLAFEKDSSEQRPLILTDILGQDFPAASMGTVPVYLDDAIPATLKLSETGCTSGANGKEDTIIACRPEDFVIFYSPLKTMVDLESLSGGLGARFLLWRYVAPILNRYPTGTSFLFGKGMEPATGYK